MDDAKSPSSLATSPMNRPDGIAIGMWCWQDESMVSTELRRCACEAEAGVQMEERLRQAELRLKGAQQEAATLRASAQDVAGAQREAALLEQELSQASLLQRATSCSMWNCQFDMFTAPESLDTGAVRRFACQTLSFRTGLGVICCHCKVHTCA